jgi:uncharacterized protein (TIGR02147 family)
MQTTKANETTDQAIEILWRKLEEAKARNQNFSLRAFAQRLGMSSGSLSEILKGKRPLSNSLKLRIAPKLLLSPQETHQFFHNDLPQKIAVTSDERIALSQDQFHLISDWWYFGLLNLLKVRGFKNQTAWMARRLGLTIQTVAEAWERLFRLGYLEQKGSQVIRKHPHLKTTDNLLDLSVRKSHLMDLPLIEKSLLELPVTLRDNISCSFAFEKKDIPRAKEMIRIFESQFLNQFGKDSGDEVYKLTVALYPLTQVTGEQ